MTSILKYICPKCHVSHGGDLLLWSGPIESKYCEKCGEEFQGHTHKWYPNGEVQDTYPSSYGFECVCGDKRMIAEQWK